MVGALKDRGLAQAPLERWHALAAGLDKRRGPGDKDEGVPERIPGEFIFSLLEVFDQGYRACLVRRQTRTFVCWSGVRLTARSRKGSTRPPSSPTIL